MVVARALLGRVLECDLGRERVAGRIVEVEAYRGESDPASHAFRGETPRTRVMFGPAGHAYVYFTYGMHHCLNIVCGRTGTAAAVLVRALEPLEGLALARERRGIRETERLMRGPGCVAKALGLTREHSGLDLVHGPLRVTAAAPVRTGRRVVAGVRVGIRVGLDRRWRFWLEGHPCVSGPGRPRRGRRGRATPPLTPSRARP